jgi:hypothetical protein
MRYVRDCSLAIFAGCIVGLIVIASGAHIVAGLIAGTIVSGVGFVSAVVWEKRLERRKQSSGEPIQLGNERLVVTSGKSGDPEFWKSEYAVPLPEERALMGDQGQKLAEDDLPPHGKKYLSSLIVFRVENRYPRQVNARARTVDVMQRSMLGATFPLEWYGGGMERLIPPGASDYVIVHRRFEYGEFRTDARPWYSFSHGTVLAVEVWCEEPHSLVRQCFQLHRDGYQWPEFVPMDCPEE